MLNFNADKNPDQALILEEELVDVDLHEYDTDVIGLEVKPADKELLDAKEQQDNKDSKNNNAPVEVIMLDKFRKKSEPNNE